MTLKSFDTRIFGIIFWKKWLVMREEFMVALVVKKYLKLATNFLRRSVSFQRGIAFNAALYDP